MKDAETMRLQDCVFSQKVDGVERTNDPGVDQTDFFVNVQNNDVSGVLMLCIGGNILFGILQPSNYSFMTS